MTTSTIAFIGGGNMATSLIAGLVADGYDGATLNVSDPRPERLELLHNRYGVATFARNSDAVAGADTLLLCLKPLQAAEVCREIAAAAAVRSPLVISVMAGVPEQALQYWLGGQPPIVRAMPNTPAMVQTGAIGLHASPEVSEDGRNHAETILRAVGLTRWVATEDQIDAVTALSGSGPAYFFLFMEALEEAGISLGLDGETARLLTIQTALGAAKMAVESTDPPGRLRERVTSPGGTTERALEHLLKADLHALMKRAARAAHHRAGEISRDLSESL
ncbi:pyrroline-5-carboxylate reductase [Thiocapsa imhoffii]|uniref:Pyrroline-5-carboxylate reductase n=1 Tax=Thiocapsa imhoffii TaxID=382777 RepID=A0A9X1B7H8_9GAMM|nr:pyrroline-5-carboxylate reductase [Thiocapsa imhoffii]MBK1643263.1 pyrroline-5-carboxylate reductase [Thiocapsa imhoffii]